MCSCPSRQLPVPRPPEPDTAPAAAATPTPLWVFGLLWFSYFAAVGAYNPFAPLWYQSLGLSTLAIGALASLQAWTRLIAPYAWSWLADHRGERSGLIRAAAWGCVLASAWLLALSLWPAQAAALAGAGWPGLGVGALLALGVALLYTANGGIVPLSEAALAQRLAGAGGAPDPARYGRVRLWGSVGFIVAVVAVGQALQVGGVALLPALVLGLHGLLLAVAWRLPASREAAHASGPVPAVWPVLRQPPVAWFFASVFCLVLAHTGLYAFFSLYLDAMGYGQSAVGALWAVSVACEIVFFYTQGRWLGRLSPWGWLQWAGAVGAVRFAATALGGASAAVLVLAQATHAVTFAAHHTACVALVAQHFPGRLRGRGQALYSALGYGLSGLVGGVGGGWLITHFGHAAVFWASAVAAGLSVLCARRGAWHAGRAGPVAGAAQA